MNKTLAVNLGGAAQHPNVAMSTPVPSLFEKVKNVGEKFLKELQEQCQPKTHGDFFADPIKYLYPLGNSTLIQDYHEMAIENLLYNANHGIPSTNRRGYRVLLDQAKSLLIWVNVIVSYGGTCAAEVVQLMNQVFSNEDDNIENIWKGFCDSEIIKTHVLFNTHLALHGFVHDKGWLEQYPKMMDPTPLGVDHCLHKNGGFLQSPKLEAIVAQATSWQKYVNEVLGFSAYKGEFTVETEGKSQEVIKQEILNALDQEQFKGKKTCVLVITSLKGLVDASLGDSMNHVQFLQLSPTPRFYDPDLKTEVLATLAKRLKVSKEDIINLGVPSALLEASSQEEMIDQLLSQPNLVLTLNKMTFFKQSLAQEMTPFFQEEMWEDYPGEKGDLEKLEKNRKLFLTHLEKKIMEKYSLDVSHITSSETNADKDLISVLTEIDAYILPILIAQKINKKFGVDINETSSLEEIDKMLFSLLSTPKRGKYTFAVFSQGE